MHTVPCASARVVPRCCIVHLGICAAVTPIRIAELSCMPPSGREREAGPARLCALAVRGARWSAVPPLQGSGKRSAATPGSRALSATPRGRVRSPGPSAGAAGRSTGVWGRQPPRKEPVVTCTPAVPRRESVRAWILRNVTHTPFAALHVTCVSVAAIWGRNLDGSWPARGPLLRSSTFPERIAPRTDRR